MTTTELRAVEEHGQCALHIPAGWVITPGPARVLGRAERLLEYRNTEN
ncbi:hypothetical protein ACIP5Y_28795 [Nocardia sp. NPDC088792]